MFLIAGGKYECQKEKKSTRAYTIVVDSMHHATFPITIGIDTGVQSIQQARLLGSLCSTHCACASLTKVAVASTGGVRVGGAVRLVHASHISSISSSVPCGIGATVELVFKLLKCRRKLGIPHVSYVDHQSEHHLLP